MAVITSDVLRGRRCPVCGAPNSSCVGDGHTSGDGTIVHAARAQSKGPMKRVLDTPDGGMATLIWVEVSDPRPAYDDRIID